MKLSKDKQIIISIIVLLSIILFAGCVTVTTDSGEYNPKISDDVMASKVDETTYEVLEQADVFAADSPEIHIVAQVSGGEANKTTIKAEWVYIDQEVFIDEAEVVVGYREGPVWFSLSMPDNGWPTGKYQVTLFADNEEMIVKFFEVK